MPRGRVGGARRAHVEVVVVDLFTAAAVKRRRSRPRGDGSSAGDEGRVGEEVLLGEGGEEGLSAREAEERRADG